ncbi:MAG: putative sulfate exporter family transporter [Pseudomonadota bacterium]
MANAIFSRFEGAGALGPGLLIAGIIALASQFVSEHYGAPAMLLALLFGIALNFLGDTKARPGMDFGARQILRLGVALLGVRISAEVLTLLGWPVIGLVVCGVALTISFGLLTSRVFGFRYRFAFLSAGAVAICGASAAMAIAAILPKDDRSEERLIFTVVGVTLLSTLAMIVYPILGGALGFSEQVTGIFIGATVHDVAQVVGAGFSVSDEAGNIATLVKLLRVILLAPVVVIGALLIRALVVETDSSGERPPIVPVFVVGFVVLAALGTAGLIPAPVISVLAEVSGWLLLTAIASVGMKTRPEEVMKVGLPAALFLVAQTVFLAVFIAVGLSLLPLSAAPSP